MSHPADIAQGLDKYITCWFLLSWLIFLFIYYFSSLNQNLYWYFEEVEDCIIIISYLVVILVNTKLDHRCLTWEIWQELMLSVWLDHKSLTAWLMISVIFGCILNLLNQTIKNIWFAQKRLKQRCNLFAKFKFKQSFCVHYILGWWGSWNPSLNHSAQIVEQTELYFVGNQCRSIKLRVAIQ